MDVEDITPSQFARIEREILIGFYSIRKLFEATAKVSPETRDLKIQLKFYPKRADQPPVDWFNRDKFWELYDLEVAGAEQRDLLYAAHRMVHSFVLLLSGDDAGHGAFFTSDRDKEARLNFVSTSEIVRVFEAVGTDYPSGLNAWRDEATGEMKWVVPPSPESVR